MQIDGHKLEHEPFRTVEGSGAISALVIGAFEAIRTSRRREGVA
jgi:hypothetical protein